MSWRTDKAETGLFEADGSGLDGSSRSEGSDVINTDPFHVINMVRRMNCRKVFRAGWNCLSERHPVADDVQNGFHTPWRGCRVCGIDPLEIIMVYDFHQ